MGTKHAPTEMTQHDVKWKKSSAKSTGVYIGLYVCATCGRETRQIKNFLGSRVLMCDGQHITKEARA